MATSNVRFGPELEMISRYAYSRFSTIGMIEGTFLTGLKRVYVTESVHQFPLEKQIGLHRCSNSGDELFRNRG